MLLGGKAPTRGLRNPQGGAVTHNRPLTDTKGLGDLRCRVTLPRHAPDSGTSLRT